MLYPLMLYGLMSPSSPSTMAPPPSTCVMVCVIVCWRGLGGSDVDLKTGQISFASFPYVALNHECYLRRLVRPVMTARNECERETPQ